MSFGDDLANNTGYGEQCDQKLTDQQKNTPNAFDTVFGWMQTLYKQTQTAAFTVAQTFSMSDANPKVEGNNPKPIQAPAAPKIESPRAGDSQTTTHTQPKKR